MQPPASAFLADRLRAVLGRPPVDLARAALLIAEIERPGLDAGRSLALLDALGARASERLAPLAEVSIEGRLDVLSTLLFEDEAFAGNKAHYGDFRNSLLDAVLDRRLGIPITLALVYLEVAGRAGVDVRGVACPGHFLMTTEGTDGNPVILDPFERGTRLDEQGCRRLLARHLGDAAQFSPALLAPCSSRHLLARLLTNLKRAYIEARSFPHARQAVDLLLTVDPTVVSERRDRGLLAYHMDDVQAALPDLEHYLDATEPGTRSAREERRRLEEHVKTLRRRVASLN